MYTYLPVHRKLSRKVLCNSSPHIETFHLAGELLKQEGKQLKWDSGSPWNWPDSLCPSLPEKVIKSCESHSQKWRAREPKNTLRSDSQPGRSKNYLSCPGEASTWRGHFLPLELPVGNAVCSRFPALWAVFQTCWGGLWWCNCLWVISAPIVTPHSYSCKQLQ